MMRPQSRGGRPHTAAGNDRRRQGSLFRQVYDRIRHGIAAGSMRPGDRVPSARGLASELGIARGTVEEAYQLLVAEGYVVRRGAAGSFVADGVAMEAVLSRRPVARPRRAAPAMPASVSVRHDRDALPFQLGVPALDAFPKGQWSRIVARHARRLDATDLCYPDPLGLPRLRENIARYLTLSRGVACTAEQIVVTGGFQGALGLTARTVLEAGDEVWLEDPGYTIAHHPLAAAGARLSFVPVDREGLIVAAGEKQARTARLALVTPSHQFPTCVPLSLPRRMALLAWARRSGAWIIEDDYDGEFHYAGRPLPALKSIDRDDRVLYAGSFSKTLFPGLRLGYVVVPAELLGHFVDAIKMADTTAPAFLQSVVATFMEEGHFGRHLRRMRSLYGARRAALIGALKATFGPRLDVVTSGGGLHLLARLPPRVRDTTIGRLGASRGLALHTLSPHCRGTTPQHALILPFTNVRERMALQVAQRLARAIGAHLADAIGRNGRHT
jgi:GntR family transcriptional regulator/MocR family aminotransferase